MRKMHGQCYIFLLTYAVTVAIPDSLAFTIDMTNPDIYNGEQKDFFGYKVLPFISGTNKGIIVTAPLQSNGSGAICTRGLDKEHKCFKPGGISLRNTTIAVKHLGLSIARDSKRSQITVCSPNVAHKCNENSYLNSVCYNMTDNLDETSVLTPAFQECTKKTVDLVFLFDGSGSMTEAEFNKNKYFIKDIMKNLTSTSIKFAAVQFSIDCRKVFDFKDYQAGTALEKLKNERHMKSLTNTHRALKFVLEEILENPAAGASPDATKVLVLITDGDPSDSDNDHIIDKYDDKSIVRFVIGVKDANLDKFRAIASRPKDKNAFKIENYDGLAGVLQSFQNKIFKMEGSKVARAGDMTNEMSQSGFSAVFSKDTLILGSVGSNSWRGSLQELREGKLTQIEDPQMQMDSYMGYSTAVGEKHNTTLYFVGAPRFEHEGQVVLFKRDGKNWTAGQRVHGPGIGSYFGAELCSVDVNSDGSTDFLLVGAPQFYQPQENREGQIYVYTLTNEMQLKSELNVPATSMGRFGTSISSLADLNGDGLRDVAVGAPLEDDNRGVVYIFLGDRHTGIRSTFSQRIMGQKITSGLRFFGQAIDGNIDLGEDGLPDLVVGSQGKVVVLRSRPVFTVTAHLSFQPKEISTDPIDCLGNTDTNLPMVNLTTCFEMVETTKSKADALLSRLNISYMLNVDPMRQTYRGFFSQTDRKARTFIHTCELKNGNTCFKYSVYMPKCVKDTLTPVSIKLNFFQADNESTGAILNVDSKQQAVTEIPFERQCRENDTCVADLKVDFNFMSATLLVAEDNYFNLTVKLSNDGDDSYNTSLLMQYPPGLSFSRMILAEATRPTLHKCYDQEDLDKTVCGVNLPLYRSKSSATFKTSFHIITDSKWNDSVSVTIAGKSDNANSSATNSLTKTIPVQFEIKMAVTVRDDTITYLNFSTEDTAPKQMVNIYQIDNLGWKPFPVNVSLLFPTNLEHSFEMNNYQVFVKENKTQCSRISDMTTEYCSPEKHCKIIMCDSFILDKESTVEFKLSGDVQFRDLKQLQENVTFLKRYTGDDVQIKFKSFLDVSYDNKRYVLDSHKQESKEKSSESGLQKGHDSVMKGAEVQVEFIIPPNHLLIILTGSGLGLLLLIIIVIIMVKLGCFKRRKMYDQDSLSESNPAPTDDIVPISGTTKLKESQEHEEEAAFLLDVPSKSNPDPTSDRDRDNKIQGI
uniref:integrin alpha-D n=1 Tax=Scatophagus argus TaxID=75038 RepID=UPI001ED813CD|nr:integrin alpha-D [Scatophagus argus]